MYRNALEKLETCNKSLWESSFEISVVKLELLDNKFHLS